MQSITWEARRGLFTPAERSSDAFSANIDGLWRQYKAGRLSQQTVQKRIMRHPSLRARSAIRSPAANPAPQWLTGDDRVEDEEGRE
jgi:hypothetical protein